MKINEIDFNEKWAKSHSKEDFIKVHSHHAGEVDLGAVHDQLNGVTKPDAKAEKAK